MHVELVRAKTADGMRLDGALQQPTGARSPAAPLDAIVALHGVGSNFYSSTMMESLSVALVAAGIAVVRVNTRGHDGVNTVASDQGGKIQGAAFERVDDCRHDVDAWVRFLLGRGFHRLGILGHSLGAVKLLYSQAQQPDSAVQRLVAISPPRLSFARFLKAANAAEFRSSLAAADELLAAGQPDMLFRATFPFSLILSAATFVDKYGPTEKYNLFRFVQQVPQPIDFIFGAQELVEGGAAFAEVVPELEAVAWRHGPPSVTVVPNANHFYSGCLPQLIEVVKRALLGPSSRVN